MEEKKGTFPGTFSKNSKNLQYSYRFCFELSLLITLYKKDHQIFTCITFVHSEQRHLNWLNGK